MPGIPVAQGGVVCHNYVWDGSNWVVETQPGGSGGGGTSSNFGSPFPASGTAAGFQDSGGAMAPVVLESDGSLPVTVVGGAGGGDATAANQVLEIADLDKLVAQTIDYATGGGVEETVVYGIALPGNTGPVAGGTSTNPIRVDPTGSTPQPVTGTFWQATQPISGTVTANAGTNLNTSALATEVTLATRLSESDFDTKIGSLTETAPTTDTASSGLNGRLQRIAQRLTSLITAVGSPFQAGGSIGNTAFQANAGTNLNTSLLALEAGGNLAAIKADVDKIPSQGQALAAASMPVVLTALQVTALTPPAAITGYATETTLATRLSESDFDTKTGSLTETAPATDTASSGLNGRLQRIAQRLTTLITAVGTPFQAGGSIGNTAFTANAGTNLNTSLLALEAGGNLAAIKTDVDKIPSQGQALAAASMPVVLTAAQITTLTPPAAIAGFATETTLGTRLSESDFDTKTGSLTETAPATDTASSGLNGRLQRIAQRLTTLITATGSPFQAGGSIGNTTFAATQATASSLNAQVVGAVASAGSNAGNPVKTGSVFNTTQPTVTTGQIVDNQATARGAQIVAPGVENFAVQAAQSGTWTVQPGNTPNSTAWKVDGSAVTQPVSAAVGSPVFVTPTPSTSGGWSPSKKAALSNTNAQVKSGAGTLGGWYIYNPNASIAYVQIYDTATGSITVGTTPAVLSIGIPATSAANLELTLGIAFATAICVAATTAAGNATAPGTALDCNFWFK